ncbi:MAG: HAD family hydrolase [Parcubacteria group bacterium]
MRASPRGVLFDVGNVIVGWNPRRLYSQLFPEAAACDEFLARVCSPAWHHRHDMGVPFDDNAAALIAEHPHHENAIRAWDARFLEMVGPVIAETEAVMDELAARDVPMFGLTNMPSSKWPQIRAMTPAFGHLRDVVVSGDIGVTKPDARAFEIACERAGMRPGELLFVDDFRPNIEAADALGFHVHHFTDPAALRPELVRLGLL